MKNSNFPFLVKTSLGHRGLLFQTTETPRFETRWAKNADDLKEVAKLRQLAYSAAGKISENGSIVGKVEQRDRHAKVLMIYRNGILAASGRVTFCSKNCKCETEEYVHLNSPFPCEHDRAEFSRLAIHPRFRGGRLLSMLLIELVHEALKDGRRYLFGGASGLIKDIYSDLGGKPTGLFYTHRELNDLPHEIFIWDLRAIFTSSNLNLKQKTIVQQVKNRLRKRKVENVQPQAICS